MASIEWRKEFASGNAGVDSEHAQLIDAINALVGKLGDHPSKALLADVLGAVHGKISAHFEAEEKVMRERGYDQYADHKADHEILLDEIRGIMNAADQLGTFVPGDALVKRASCWFTEHFKTRDKRLHRTLG
jgi:hemerythrin